MASQLFKRRSSSLFRLALALAVASALAVFGLGMQLYSSSYYTQVRVIQEQPVPFSHRHHAGELGLDCRYCHTSVETSSFAGIPSASTCMHCHSQIWLGSSLLEPVRRAYASGRPFGWSRVHNLPDYVYFNHSIHVAKGVGCVSCHGKVNEMPMTWKTGSLQMLWCLNCHRNPEQFVRPTDKVFDMDWKPSESQAVLGKRLVDELHISSKTDCYTCHR